MKKFTLVIPAAIVSILAITSIPSNGQILFSNGALVHVTQGAIVQVNGGFQDDNLINGGQGIVTNDGDMTVTSNGAWPGNIHISNTATLQGNGKYHLDQDWINDAIFIDGNSTVDMYGNLKELITSNNATVTTFDTLMLRGTGTAANRRKQQTLDANVDHALILNDRVLFTAGHTMFITTPTLSAVTNNTTYQSEGFVSSIATGSLSRVTNANSMYYFPVGADSVVTRYRKIQLTPAAANSDTYTVRLANNDATNDGDSIGLMDTSFCKLNSLYYHKIKRTAGIDNADIDVFYDPSADGIWNMLGQWNTPTANEWNNLGAVTYTPSAPYSDVLKPNWGDFSNDPYILGEHKPTAPSLTGNPYCASGTGTFTATGDSGSYIWTVPAGDTILSGNGTGSVVVSGSVPGNITVYNQLTGCSSSLSSAAITLIPSPVAGFDTTSMVTSSGIFNNTYQFTDTSKPAPITAWHWTFGDGDTANIADPGYTFEAGTYQVTETVSNAQGCKASKTETITVKEGIFVPNVFTPNGDGQNDVFLISAVGVKVFSIEIFNRWGEKVFTSTAPEISWDGRTSAGLKASDGDYYYILTATSYSGQDWSTHGYLQLISGN
ncbi:MAG TPA: gliding motility-associated C-terminal domain-containing protein [Bacteroidia bacterium]|nr:gliding motility-associated C-terminal domain-containing protein [Bacteroidia bacterium]